MIVVTNTNIFRYSAKLDIHWFPWQPQFIKIHVIPLFLPWFISKYTLFQWFQLIYQVRFVLAYDTLPLIACCHGNEKLKSLVCSK